MLLLCVTSTLRLLERPDSYLVVYTGASYEKLPTLLHDAHSDVRSLALGSAQACTAFFEAAVIVVFRLKQRRG